MAPALAAGAAVAFVGLGRMGLPMASRLAEAGFVVRGADVAERARAALAASGRAEAFPSPAEAAAGADAIVLMLPTSAEVEEVLIGGGVIDAAGSPILIDMSSSEPLRTRALAERAAAAGVAMIDAPVSGGVSGAQAGTLTIMVGGEGGAVEACRPLLEALGRNVVHVGPVGAGHALKALNNLLSASHLLASCEAIAVGREFGLDPRVMVDAINTSTGRSASTERKLPEFILSGTFDSGFALRLMLKDVGIAVSLGDALGVHPALGERTRALWSEAAAALSADADHTEIARWIDAGAGAART